MKGESFVLNAAEEIKPGFEGIWGKMSVEDESFPVVKHWESISGNQSTDSSCVVHNLSEGVTRVQLLWR